MWLFALNMTWTFCEVYWHLDFEPSENQWRAANGIWGVRYLAWRLVFVLDFDNWSMGAKPWNTSGGQPVVFGLSGNPKPRKVINLRSSSKLASFCWSSLAINSLRQHLSYLGFRRSSTSRRASETLMMSKASKSHYCWSMPSVLVFLGVLQETGRFRRFTYERSPRKLSGYMSIRMNRVVRSRLELWSRLPNLHDR